MEWYNVGMALLIITGVASLIYIIAVNPYMKYLDYLKQVEEFAKVNCKKIFNTDKYEIINENTFTCYSGANNFTINFKKTDEGFKIINLR